MSFFVGYFEFFLKNRAEPKRMSLPINDLPYYNNSNSSDSNATGPKSESSTGNFNCFTEQKPEIRNQNQKNQNFGNNLNQNHNSHLNSAATSHIVQAASKPSIISRSHVIQPQQHHTRFAEAANSLNKSKHMRLFSRYIYITVHTYLIFLHTSYILHMLHFIVFFPCSLTVVHRGRQ